jgi:drug/metabolite transporter (DMT)-like permease
VPTNELITTKMVTQSLLSIGLLVALGQDETQTFISQVSLSDLQLISAVVIWSGLAVNCLAPYLQVSGQQAIGPARAQILYASQPLWAAGMSYFFLGELVGTEGLIGGSAFLIAMFLAATAETPDPDCPQVECEV